MSLSEQEQRALREIEQSLLADDPKFGSSVMGDSYRVTSGGTGHIGLRAFALGLIGFVLLVAGVALSQQSMWFIAISVVGFLVMFGAGVWALRKNSSDTSFENVSAQPSRNRANREGFDSKMEDSFRRRFDR